MNNPQTETQTPYHACFVLVPVEDGFAATTREGSDTYGLPGGKMEPGELGWQCAIREAGEEGWDILPCAMQPFHTAMVEGNLVAWYEGFMPVKLKNYKEMHRIKNVVATKEQLCATPYGFEQALKAYHARGPLHERLNLSPEQNNRPRP